MNGSHIIEIIVKIALIGDSTVTDGAGWGKVFAGRFADNVQVLNFAVGGRSSKSWYDEGRLPAALNAKPTYALIQFGHNDQPGKGPERETDPATSYRDYLRLYVGKLREIGTQPILVSPVTRRTFDANGRINSTLAPWAEAAQAVAQESNVPFINLHKISVDYHNAIGRDASMAFNPKEGDRTHFNRQGATVIADLLIEGLGPTAKDLCQYLKQLNTCND
ncbi:MAG: pectin esterase [Candidatus Latescibacteria bacterium]|nr:pectin esterase [Candidatus Latescibacterota bacterium]